MEKDKNKVMNGIIDALKELCLESKDFKEREIAPGKKTGTNMAHKKVVDKIKNKWRISDGFGIGTKPDFDPVTLGVDFIGREYQDGKILLAVEVDTWRKPRRSWLKLADLRAENKVWIHITDSKAAKVDFSEAINNLKDLLRVRQEDEKCFGNFIAILKTPEDLSFEDLFNPSHST